MSLRKEYQKFTQLMRSMFQIKVGNSLYFEMTDKQNKFYLQEYKK